MNLTSGASEQRSQTYLSFRKKRLELSMIEETCKQNLAHQIKCTERQRRLGYPHNNTHKYDFKKRQEQRFIIYSILKYAMKHEKLPVNELCKIIGLSWCQYKYYTKYLIGIGMMVRNVNWTCRIGKGAGNPKTVHFTITEKGKKYIQLFNGLKTMFNVSDGLNLFGYDSI